MKKLVILSMVLFVIGIGFAAFVNAGKEDLVGTKVVNDMKIELYHEDRALYGGPETRDGNDVG